MKRRPRTPLERAVSLLQTSGTPYRLETDAEHNQLRLYIRNVTVPQIYTSEGIPCGVGYHAKKY
jgi:hypothetical protein